MDDEIVICSSVTRENVYFIYRKTGTEVEVSIAGNIINAQRTLTDEETEFIKKYILKKEL